jgi:hypothetical protein
MNHLSAEFNLDVRVRHRRELDVAAGSRKGVRRIVAPNPATKIAKPTTVAVTPPGFGTNY